MKKILITGGADGIGYAIAEKFQQQNYLVYSIDLKQTKNQLKNVKNYIGDIRDEKLVDSLLKEIGKIDILVNNAAIQTTTLFKDTSIEDIKDVINTNILGTVTFTNQTLPYLNNNSQIINIGSIHSTNTRTNKLTYDVSKAALDSFTKTLALELAPNIRVNQVSFGAVHTPMNHAYKTNKEEMLIAQAKVPLNHIFDPKEIAEVVYQITTNEFKYLTGSIIKYDAGRDLS